MKTVEKYCDIPIGSKLFVVDTTGSYYVTKYGEVIKLVKANASQRR